MTQQALIKTMFFDQRSCFSPINLFEKQDLRNSRQLMRHLNKLMKNKSATGMKPV